MPHQPLHLPPMTALPPDPMKALHLAASILGIDLDARGGQTKFAKVIGTTRASVSSWLRPMKSQRSEPSPKFAKEIERLTGGQIKREWIRPDIFG